MCRSKIRQQPQGFFWANSRILLNRLAPIHHRLLWWRSLCKGLGDYRFGLWPLQSSDVRDIDACNRKLLFLIVGLRPEPGEAKQTFCIRRSRAVKRKAARANVDVAKQWALKTVTWLEHLHRHPDSPAARLVVEQTPQWLETCRILAGRALFFASDAAGITATRSGAGRPVRYLGEWWRITSFENAAKDKALSLQRADLIRSVVMR